MSGAYARFPYSSTLSLHSTLNFTMASTGNGVAYVVPKLLGINVHYRDEPRNVSDSYLGTDGYIEEEPTFKEWLSQFTPSGAGITHYIKTLFPFWNWIFHYNLQWFFGDFIAG
jgi:sodium-independent sulfate anion transporter 11